MTRPTRPRRPHPGRLPPAEQRAAAEAELAKETEIFRAAQEQARRDYEAAMAAPTQRWHDAIVRACGSPEGVQAAEKKSLVTRKGVMAITGLGQHKVQEIVDAAKGDAVH
ncbi:hypothetical protein [Nonomuraea roseola]|uniref:Uncharacterized protein n=1 Tax=Nonomuraea roseola TaxID=46179 RepID=A0ABV5QF89_9ACTN